MLKWRPVSGLLKGSADGDDTGCSPWWCYAFSTMFGSVREHRWAAVSGEVARLTGQPPQPFGEWLATAGR